MITIEKVTFNKIDTSGFLKTLAPAGIVFPKSTTVFYPEQKTIKTPNQQTYAEPFSVLIKDITFIAGAVTFRQKIQPIQQQVNFTIINQNIIPEYDAVKNYFSNVLNTKRITVTPAVTMVDGVITAIHATSKEIDKIDQSLLEEVKLELIKKSKETKPADDRQLFTMQEYIDAFINEKIDAEKFFKDEDDFFNFLVERSGTKHYKQLRFLSGKHNADLLKLRFVHKPFSFVFLLIGASKFHIIWETLDTEEATYVWNFPADKNNLQHVLTTVDKTINKIINGGRNNYRNEKEENFIRIYHDYEDLQNGFKKWKEQVEKLMK